MTEFFFSNGKGKITRKCRIDYDQLIILVCIFKDNREFSPIGKAEQQENGNRENFTEIDFLAVRWSMFSWKGKRRPTDSK